MQPKLIKSRLLRVAIQLVTVAVFAFNCWITTLLYEKYPVHSYAGDDVLLALAKSKFMWLTIAQWVGVAFIYSLNSFRLNLTPRHTVEFLGMPVTMEGYGNALNGYEWELISEIAKADYIPNLPLVALEIARVARSNPIYTYDRLIFAHWTRGFEKRISGLTDQEIESRAFIRNVTDEIRRTVMKQVLTCHHFGRL